MKKSAIITGSGFISKHLQERFKKDNIEFLVIRHEEFWDYDSLEKKIIAYNPMLIFHTSAFGNLVTQQDENEIIQANVIHLFLLLQATKTIPYKAFINFSSSSTLQPYETLYSATKGSGERICKAFATKYEKNIITVLPYTVVGVGEAKEHLIPTLIRSCLTGEKMNFIGTPVHDFISVNDFIDALKLIVNHYHLKGNVEIGSGISTSNEEVLKLVEEVTGKKANITRVSSMRSYDNNSWKANTAIISSLGWVQKENLKKVIEDMVDEYDK